MTPLGTVGQRRGQTDTDLEQIHPSPSAVTGGGGRWGERGSEGHGVCVKLQNNCHNGKRSICGINNTTWEKKKTKPAIEMEFMID